MTGDARPEGERGRTAPEGNGLDQEIALLRARLMGAAAGPDGVDLLAEGVQALVRAVAAQYRLSPKARKDLSDSLAAVLNSFGDQILPTEGR